MTGSDSVQKQRSVLLTNRDLKLLHLLYEHNFMSLGQVEKYIFRGKAWPTILNRVKRLEDAAFMKRIRVGKLRSPLESRSVGVLLKLCPRGLRELQKRNLEKTYDERFSDIKEAQLGHDLLLVDVIEKLKQMHSSSGFVEGRRFVRGKSDIHRVPDFVMTEPGSSRATAIELELTMKSEKRYRQIVLAYRLTKGFERVLFITASKTIAQKIASEILGYKCQGLEMPDTGKFQFSILKEVLDSDISKNKTQN